jgi:MerR family transcriptional regulator, repressor of the yfmOP operon
MGAGMSGLRIGEAAVAAGVTSRTLRYYEQLGLLPPLDRSPGGARRYADDDLERVRRILELKELMGFDLDEIRVLLGAEDRLDALRREYRSADVPKERRRAIVEEAIAINDELRAQVRDKIGRTQRFLGELDSKARRYRTVRRELGAGGSSTEGGSHR